MDNNIFPDIIQRKINYYIIKNHICLIIDHLNDNSVNYSTIHIWFFKFRDLIDTFPVVNEDIYSYVEKYIYDKSDGDYKHKNTLINELCKYDALLLKQEVVKNNFMKLRVRKFLRSKFLNIYEDKKNWFIWHIIPYMKYIYHHIDWG